MRSLPSENRAVTKVIVLHGFFVLARFLVKCLVVCQRCGSKSQRTPSRVAALLSMFQFQELRDQIGQSSANAGLPTDCAKLWVEEFLLPSLPTQIRMLHQEHHCKSFPTHGVSTAMVNEKFPPAVLGFWHSAKLLYSLVAVLENGFALLYSIFAWPGCHFQSFSGPTLRGHANATQMPRTAQLSRELIRGPPVVAPADRGI